MIQGLQPIFDLRRPIVIAGPCSAESESQVMSVAASLAGQGIKVMRAGAWKPRTKPGGFEGFGAEALVWLARAKERFGIDIATEVATRAHLRQAIEAGIDGIWIGARTTSNPFAVQEIADALSELPESCRERLTVMIKNPISPDLELWIGAIERVYGAGIRRIGAIHRGFGAYGKSLYRNEPRWAIPIELSRRVPGLPLLCDPSHIGGSRDLIAPLSQQAMNLGFGGLFVECHPSPCDALSDASQQITPGRLREILSGLKMPSESVPAETLEMLRLQIDQIDDELLELLARRMAVSRQIGEYKHTNNMSVLQPHRYNDLIERRGSQAEKLSLSADFIKALLATVHEESVRQQLIHR